MPEAYPFDLPPEEAIAWFRAKGLKPSFSWEDVWGAEHSKNFTVAKAMRLDILQDIKTACDKSLAGGETFRTFTKELRPVLEKKGWWGKTEMLDPGTGEQRPVTLGTPSRLKTIFNNNLFTSYAAGRYEQMMSVTQTRPYWRYVAVMDGRTRHDHRRLNGIILPFDHKFWQVYYPPNGYNCRCIVSCFSKKEVDQNGWEIAKDFKIEYYDHTTRTGEVIPTAKHCDPGWDHNHAAAPWSPDKSRWPDKTFQEVWENKSRNEVKYLKTHEDVTLFVDSTLNRNDQRLVNILPHIEENITQIKKALPEQLKNCVEILNIRQIRNPADGYWTKIYGIKDFASAATCAPGEIDLWKPTFDQFQNPANTALREEFRATMRHEFGHAAAMIQFLGKEYPDVWEKFTREEGWSSLYSSQTRRLAENVAETVLLFLAKSPRLTRFPQKQRFLQDLFSQ